MTKGCILMFIFILIFTLCSGTLIKKSIDDIFSLDADETFASEVGEDFYEARRKLQEVSYDPKELMNSMPINEKYNVQNATALQMNVATKAPNITTTEKALVATVPPEITAKKINLTLREIKMKQFKLQFENVMNSNRTIADYISNSDVDTLTQKLDQIIEAYKMQSTETRRETYSFWEKHTWVKVDTKRRLRNLMTHFVYITRYKLIFPQVLRQKYIDSYVYKIGFLFALLRHLKNMQKWIYWALQTNGSYGANIVGTMYHDLKLVEKLQRLDVDIKDAVLLLQKWEYRGNIESNPKYYDYSLERD